MPETIYAQPNRDSKPSETEPLTSSPASNKNPLDVNIESSNVSIGGGTEYTEGDTDATITGSAIMFESNTGSNTLSVVNNTTPLPISDAGGTISIDDGGGSITIDGSVTATIQEPLSIDDNGGSITIDATSLPLPTGAATQTTLSALNAKFNSLGQKTMANSAPVVISSNQSAIPSSQSGTWNINNISGTVSLPTGAATESTLSTISSTLTTIEGNQLADGHNVTVDNGSGASAVNIQDGGNSITIDDGGGSITVDGTVSIQEPLSIDDNGGSITVDGSVSVTQSTASSLQGQVEGTTATGAAVPNPVHIGGRDISGNLRDFTAFQAGVLFTVPTVITDGTGTSVASVSSGAMSVKGQVAHDASGTSVNPVLTGAVANDDATAITDVSADGDLVRFSADHKGRLYNRNFSFEKEVDLSGLDETFDNTTSTVSSADIDAEGFRFATLMGDFTVGAGTPTDMQITIEQKDGAGNYRTRKDSFISQYIFTDTTISADGEVCEMFRIPGGTFRVTLTATGVDASNTFTSANFVVLLST